MYVGVFQQHLGLKILCGVGCQTYLLILHISFSFHLDGGNHVKAG